jgi:nucleoside phosphorylase
MTQKSSNFLRESLLNSCSTIGELGERLIRSYPVTENRDLFLKETSKLLVDLCSEMKASVTGDKRQFKLFDQLYGLALDLSLRIEDFTISIGPDEENLARVRVEAVWISLVDGLQKLESLYGPTDLRIYFTGKSIPPVLSAVAKQSPVDFVIITPLGEERDALLRKLKGWRKLPPREEDIRVYYSAELSVEFADGNKSEYRVIVVPLVDMGERDAANATTDALRLWRPRFVALVGIAGGLRKAGVKVGDILIATHVADCELQKLTTDGPTIRWRVHTVNQQLLLAEQNFLDDRWMERMDVPRPEPGVPRIKRGVICTGNKVIANNLAEQYHQVWDRLIGVEMEAGGVAGAAFSRVDPPGFFMVRGVSDLADSEKDHADTSKWREYACDAAATYTVALLTHGPVPNRRVGNL